MELQHIFNIILLLLALYSLYVYFKTGLDKNSSKKKLKAMRNATRTLTEEEIKYLTPYLKIYNLSLHSNDVYKMTGAAVSLEGYTVRNNQVLAYYADDIEMVFPYELEEAVQGEEDIEYVILSKKGKPFVAAAVKVNEFDINVFGRKHWGEDDPRETLETVHSTRQESKTEYRLRLSKIVQGWSAFWLFCAGFFFFFAADLRMVEPFVVLISLGGVCGVCALLAWWSTRKNHNALKDVQHVEGRFSTVMYRDSKNATVEIIQPMLGLNYPLADVDERLKKEGVNLENIDRMEAFLCENKTNRYERMASPLTRSVDEVYQQKILRPYKRITSFIVLGVTGLAIAWSMSLSYKITTKDMLISVASYIPQGKSQVYSDLAELTGGDIRLFGRVELKGNGGMEPEISFFDNDQTPFVNLSSARLNSTTPLDMPFMSPAIARIESPDFFHRLPKRRTVGMSMAFKLRAENKLKNTLYFGIESKTYNNPYLVIKPGLLDKPQEVSKALDDVCDEFKMVSCDELYNYLAKEFSNDKNYYLNGMEDRYDTILSGDEFKALLNREVVMIEEESFNTMSKYFQEWVSIAVSNSLSKKQFPNLDKDRGGVVIRQPLLLSGLFEKRGGRDDVVSAIRKMQNMPYDISGIISGVKTEGNVVTIDLMDPDPFPRQDALATALIGLVGLIALLYGLWCLLFPACYPRHAQMTGTSAISRYT